MAEQPERNLLDPNTLNRIARLELRARRAVEGYISGRHRSPFQGFSVEFATHREYTPGDEIKHIDWKVWARADRLFIKQYEEETNLRCTLLVDCSRSMRYEEGGRHMSKFDYAVTLAASLAFLLQQQQQDAVGLVLFDSDVRVSLPASSNPGTMKRLMHELSTAKPDSTTDVSGVFRRLAEEIPRRGMVALISDLFVDPDVLSRSLRRFRHRRHDVVVFHVMHDHELEFPFSDNTMFEGLEDQVELLADPRALRESYLDAVDGFLARVRRDCARGGMDYMLTPTSLPLDAALSTYLAFRRRCARAILGGPGRRRSAPVGRGARGAGRGQVTHG